MKKNLRRRLMRLLTSIESLRDDIYALSYTDDGDYIGELSPQDRKLYETLDVLVADAWFALEDARDAVWDHEDARLKAEKQEPGEAQ